MMTKELSTKIVLFRGFFCWGRGHISHSSLLSGIDETINQYYDTVLNKVSVKLLKIELRSLNFTFCHDIVCINSNKGFISFIIIKINYVSLTFIVWSEDQKDYRGNERSLITFRDNGDNVFTCTCKTNPFLYQIII